MSISEYSKHYLFITIIICWFKQLSNITVLQTKAFSTCFSQKRCCIFRRKGVHRFQRGLSFRRICTFISLKMSISLCSVTWTLSVSYSGRTVYKYLIRAIVLFNSISFMLHFIIMILEFWRKVMKRNQTLERKLESIVRDSTEISEEAVSYQFFLQTKSSQRVKFL